MEPLSNSEKHTPLSSVNKQVLEMHLRDKCDPILNTSDNEGILSKIFSWLPSSQSTGKLVAETQSTKITNSMICMITDLIFPKNELKQKSYGEAIFNMFFSVAKPTLTETVKIVVTPTLLPYVTMVCQGIGGLALPAAVSLTTLILNRILSDPNTKYSSNKLPALNQLVIVKDGKYIDANGNQLMEQDLQDIRVAVNRYDLVCKLLAADKEDIEAVFYDYIKVDATIHSDEPLSLKYADGTEVSAKEQQKIILAFQRLKSQNVTGESMWKVIKLLADHLPVPLPVEPVIEKCEDNWLLLEDI